MTGIPWHQQQWSIIGKALQTQRLPHALLLHGPRGLGKNPFMQQLAAVLVCANPEFDQKTLVPRPCGECRPCNQIGEEGERVDVFHLRPEEEGKQIKIDITREAIEFSGLASHYGGRKLLLIEPAEALNLNAANALLKTLEEPARSTTLILLSHQPSRLLPTIRSRCLQLRFAKPTRQQAVSWLREQGIDAAESLINESHGYPYKALAMAEAGLPEWRQQRDRELHLFLSQNRSAAGLARLWSTFEAAEIHAWLHDRIRRSNWDAQGEGGVSGDTGDAATQELIKRPELRRLEPLCAQLDRFLRNNINNINKQLLMESILISMKDGAPDVRAS